MLPTSAVPSDDRELSCLCKFWPLAVAIFIDIKPCLSLWFLCDSSNSAACQHALNCMQRIWTRSQALEGAMWDGLPHSQTSTVEGMFKGCSFQMASVTKALGGTVLRVEVPIPCSGQTPQGASYDSSQCPFNGEVKPGQLLLKPWSNPAGFGCGVLTNCGQTVLAPGCRQEPARNCFFAGSAGVGQPKEKRAAVSDL